MRDKMHLEVGDIWRWDFHAGGRGGSGLSLDAVLMFEMYGEALRMIDKEIDEHEEMIRELEKQEEDENDEEREDRDSE